jgi:hypothetical protein
VHNKLKDSFQLIAEVFGFQHPIEMDEKVEDTIRFHFHVDKPLQF